ncbi:MAG: DUF58 domain-containing protein, partial [Gemmatimonadetes bacterium]|nr:DUF58 domain-containing protein [Gemmatimonadota bacterium]NIU79483.1 DUF58 domain-containing protein [Gammaproteobacteria bacterium]NIX48126.1 DUF58 domain-containing protein [Gemmatimonadota bacterium]NIY12507.1 DUF58 domain-containing protein [Gemmatimonadota bacterium]
AVNYDNGLAYLFTFLLASCGFVSMFYTHRNLAGVTLSGGSPRPVFAGERAGARLTLANPDR